jgi:hypothetical protein
MCVNVKLYAAAQAASNRTMKDPIAVLQPCGFDGG